MATVQPAPQGADPGRALTPRPLVIVGGGEHARVVIEAARSRPDAWAVIGIVGPDPTTRTRGLLDVAYLGSDADLVERLERTVPDLRPWCVLGFVGPQGASGRAEAVRRIGPAAHWATIVHDRAWISPSATVGEGSVVLAGAIVNTGAAVGRHAIVNTGAIVEHDAVLGDHVHIGPAAVLGGGAQVGAGALVALGARVRDHVEVGPGATVGMGAVAVEDVAAGVVVVGSPARPLALPDAPAGDGS